MSQRVIVGLQPSADWSEISKRLITAGAESVSEPSTQQPDVLITTISSERVQEFLEQIKRLKGVRYAEPDTWRISY